MSYEINGLYSTTGKHSLNPPRIVQTLDEGEFLDLLNSPPKLVGQIGPYSSAERLRGWIDQWLDSGFGTAGDEHPADRHLHLNTDASEAVRNYSDGKMTLFAYGDGLTLYFRETEEPKPSYIYTKYDAYAQRFLVFFLLSDLRHTLAKCRDKDCGRYFILKRWNQPYSRGTKCPVHQRASSLESAKKATSADRIEAENALYGLAAQRFSKVIHSNPNWHTDPKVKITVARYLNDRISRSPDLGAVYLSGARKGITGKWLARTKNWQGIQNALGVEKQPVG